MQTQEQDSGPAALSGDGEWEPGGIHSRVTPHILVLYGAPVIQGESWNSVVPQMSLPETRLGKACSSLSAQLAKKIPFKIASMPALHS